MKTRIRILHVDDSVHDRILVQDALEKEHDEYEIISVDNREKFEKYLSVGDFDLVLSDFNILGFDGLQVLEVVKNRNPDLPVIIVTGTGSEEIAIQAMKMGAADYVIKSVKHIQGLSPTIKSVLEHSVLIKQHKESQRLLKENELLFKTLTEEAPVGIFKTDPNGNTTYVNPIWCTISGISYNEATGNGWINAVHPDDRNLLQEGWQHAVKNKIFSVAEYRFLRQDGSITWVSGKAVPQLDPNGNLVGYIGTATDITERKLAEQKLHETLIETQRLSDALNHVSSHIYMKDTQSRYIYANKSTLELFGCSAEELVGRDDSFFSLRK